MAMFKFWRQHYLLYLTHLVTLSYYLYCDVMMLYNPRDLYNCNFKNREHLRKHGVRQKAVFL
jgi:hypothetical protein